MPQPFYVTALNLGGVVLTTVAGVLYVAGSPISGGGGGGGSTIIPADVVRTTGNQNVSGTKTFLNGAHFSGVVVAQTLTGQNEFGIDLNNGVLFGSNGYPVVDWNNQKLSGNWSADSVSGKFYGDGTSLGLNPAPSGVFQSNKINLMTTGSYKIVSGVPLGYMYLIDSIECVFLNNATASVYPSFFLGSGALDNSIISSNSLLSVSGVTFGQRFIYDVPTNAISGDAYLTIFPSGQSTSPLSGVFLVRGVFIKYV